MEVTKSERIVEYRASIFQIYYDQHSKKSLDHDLIPFFNSKKNEYFENSVMVDVYKLDVQTKFIGITSTRFTEKTKLTGKDLLNIADKYHDMDVIIYDYYRKILKSDIWRDSQYPERNRIARLLNEQKILPFDLFEKKWVVCYCNYWIAKKAIFNDYVKNVLQPTLDFFESEEMKNRINNSGLSHRGQKYPIHPFVLEGLFGTYLAHHPEYKIHSHF